MKNIRYYNFIGIILLSALPILYSSNKAHAVVRVISWDFNDSMTPQINDEGQVVWRAKYVGGWEIFFNDEWTIFTQKRISQNLPPNISDSKSPQINNAGQVVWEGWDGKSWDIFLYDSGTITNISNNRGNDESPQINDAGRVVWLGQIRAGGYDVFLYDGNSKTNISNGRVYNDNNPFVKENDSPQINNAGQVVWRGQKERGGYDIFLYDGVSVTDISNNSVDDRNPQINNAGEVVWMQDASYTADTAIYRFAPAIYVDDDNTVPPHNGNKFSPFNKIEDAINLYPIGDTIYVAKGIYQENILLGITVILEGGWDSSFSQRDISANETIIDGSGSPDTVIKCINNNSTIDGFTITNGNSPVLVDGGGISIIGGGSPVITNNIIIQNTTGEQGGGIYIDGVSPFIANNTIKGNHANELGGGIMVRAALPDTLIANNIISENSAADGGGICNYFTSHVMVNNVITDNSAVDGGGIYLYGEVVADNTSIISNNTIANNAASSGNGGGIYLSFDAVPTITNTILWGNGDDIYIEEVAAGINVLYSDIEDADFVGINGNISTDPLFINPATGNYALQPGSPAIDTGMDTSGTSFGSVLDDITGTTRPQDGDGLGAGGTGDGSDYDIGAIEHPTLSGG